MNPSIRQRLLWTLLSATLMVWVGTAIKNYYDNRREIAELFDAQLAQSARALLALSAHEMYEQLPFIAQSQGYTRNLPERIKRQAHKYEQHLAFQIWSGDGILVALSDSAPTDPLAGAPDIFSDQVIKGHRWRVYALVDPEKKLQVQVGERYDHREQLSDDVALRLLAAVVLWRKAGDSRWREAPMAPLGNDRWRGSFTAAVEYATYEFTVEGWVDRVATWQYGLDKKIAAGQDVGDAELANVECQKLDLRIAKPCVPRRHHTPVQPVADDFANGFEILLRIRSVLYICPEPDLIGQVCRAEILAACAA